MKLFEEMGRSERCQMERATLLQHEEINSQAARLLPMNLLKEIDLGEHPQTCAVREEEIEALIKQEGLLQDYARRTETMSSLDLLYPEVMGERNGWLGGDGDQWERGPYWIDGLLPLAYILDDDLLKQKIQPWIEWTLASQREDGFFGPSRNFEPEIGLQRNNSEDWWPRMVVLKVLKQYYSATGDKRVITFLTNYFHYQLRTLPYTPLGNWTFWAEYRACDNLQIVYWLYNITGDSFLLDLGKLLHQQSYDYVDMFWNRDDLTRINTIHGVNLAQGIKEPIIYYQQDPDSLYIHAVKKAFADIRKYHGQPQGMYGLTMIFANIGKSFLNSMNIKRVRILLIIYNRFLNALS